MSQRKASVARRLPRWWIWGALALLAPHAWGAGVPDLERGRLLYDNHCIVCHTSKVHRRIPSLPMDVSELRRIVAAWAKGQQLRWSDDDISDVAEYLDRTHYRLPAR